MKKFQIICVCYSLVLFSAIGCKEKSTLPEDFPEIFPLLITVTQEGTPLEGAMVALKPVGTANKYANGCSAVTEQNGVASIKTFGQNGVPAGKYKVLVSKSRDEGGKEVEDEFGGKSTIGAKVYSYVENDFGLESKTPFEIEVSKGGENSLSCEVGKAIHVFVRDTP